MTPEERAGLTPEGDVSPECIAANIVGRFNMVTIAADSEQTLDGLPQAIAAAIREAVAAERERLCDLADAEAWALIEEIAVQDEDGESQRVCECSMCEPERTAALAAARLAHALRAQPTSPSGKGGGQ